MTSDTRSELLPCPYCGAAAQMHDAIPLHSGASVECSECDSWGGQFKIEAEAIAAWNRRAPPKVGSGELDAAGRDIYEVANQLQGYVGPDTPKPLAAFLMREGAEAAKLADEIVRLLALASPVDHPEVAGVKIKPLVWDEQVSDYWWKADFYLIEKQKDGRCSVRAIMPDDFGRSRIIGFYVDLNAAKAAAQLDFETRIRSALQPSDSPALEAGVAEAGMVYAPNVMTALAAAYEAVRNAEREAERLRLALTKIADYSPDSRVQPALIARAALAIPAKEGGK